MEEVSEVGTLNEESTTLDKILIKGVLLYTNVASLVGQQYILPDELPSKISIQGGFCQITFYKSVSGTLFQSDKEINPFYNLEQAITFFDSHSREISGLSSPDGTAIVTTHLTKMHLVTFIRDLALSRSLGDSCPFEIVPVFIMVQRTDIMILLLPVPAF
ncbi:hypothetical protein ACJMK2_008777 [Sinanodonta woodiana]|uniref:Uncharacterized protein n=1 Tax=Sinanodonta woodiana TaxID=1069815 RepID=A0ABD3VNC5_SINWO